MNNQSNAYDNEALAAHAREISDFPIDQDQVNGNQAQKGKSDL